MCPPWLQERAKRVREWSAEAGEKFAMGIVPDPVHAFPRTDLGEQIFWFNRPPEGRLSGILFTDGSGMWPGTCLARAGWAVVQTDRFGNVEAAAYGPVPIAWAPSQTSRDGGDYAIAMLLTVAMA